MMDANIPNSVEFTEDIEVGYYSSGKVEIKDKATNEMIASHSLNLHAFAGADDINGE